MSFTQDELQSFNAILEQRLTVYRQELEYTFDRRMRMLAHEFQQQLLALQQYMMSSLPQRVLELQQQSRDLSEQKEGLQLTAQTANQEKERQQFAELFESTLANHLLAIERLLHQQPASPPSAPTPTYVPESFSDLNSIEIQAEFPWSELTDVIEKALDERLTSLHESIKQSFQDMERDLLARMQISQSEAAHQPPSNGKADYELSLSKDQE
ncbi:MAG TPA: hypothetical protein VFU49_19050 [Ktedonobacteraceae bacterium]|nr:hypothetical protein [Ktedonobacteraceae bacterium]